MKMNKYILGAVAGLALSSCNKMDYKEYTAFDHAYIVSNFEYVGGFMTTIYNNLDTDWGNFSGAMLASATDEAEYSTAGNAIEDFYNGAWSPANPRMTIWNNAWAGITYCNEMLDNWQGLTFDEFKLNSDYLKKAQPVQQLSVRVPLGSCLLLFHVGAPVRRPAFQGAQHVRCRGGSTAPYVVRRNLRLHRQGVC